MAVRSSHPRGEALSFPPAARHFTGSQGAVQDVVEHSSQRKKTRPLPGALMDVPEVIPPHPHNSILAQGLAVVSPSFCIRRRMLRKVRDLFEVTQLSGC